MGLWELCRVWDRRMVGGIDAELLPGIAGPGVPSPARLREALASCWRKRLVPSQPIPGWGRFWSFLGDGPWVTSQLRAGVTHLPEAWSGCPWCQCWGVAGG